MHSPSARAWFIVFKTVKISTMKSAKYIIILFAVAMFGLTSCGNRNTNKAGTHLHEDGSTHSDDHAAEHAAAPEQESFKAEPDSVETVPHDHGDGHDHSHEGEGAHKH